VSRPAQVYAVVFRGSAECRSVPLRSELFLCSGGHGD